MSALSPAQRLRTKTSDLTDLFRSGSSMGNRSNSQVQLPSVSDQEAAVPSKKKTSRIPFLGRSRKKSNASTGPLPVPSASSRPSIQSNLTLPRNEQPSEPVETDTEERNQSDKLLSTKSSATRAKSSSSTPQQPSTSLGSKLAAHFATTRARKRKSLPPPPEVHDGNSSSASNTLAPPNSSPRAASFESASSGTTRSPTPKPTITVSPSTEGMAQNFEGLFTLPYVGRRVTSTNPRSSRTAHAGDELGNKSYVYDERHPSSEHSSGASGPDDASTSSQQTGSSSSRSKRSKRPEIAAKIPGPSDSTATLSPESVTPKNQKRLSAPGLLSAQSEPLPPKPSLTTSLTPARVRPAQPGKPPSIPLPPPPKSPPPVPRPATSAGPGSSTPFPTTVKSTVTPISPGGNGGYPGRRQRAHTVGSSTPTTRDSGTSSTNDTGTASKTPKVPTPSAGVNNQSSKPSNAVEPPPLPPSPKPPSSTPPQIYAEPLPNFNIDTATPEELKVALISRNQQYDELASYLLKVTSAHVSERASLEKKLASMERDAARRDKEIKGLTWLVMNNRGPSYPALGLDNPGNAATGARASGLSNVNVNRSDSPAANKISARRFHIAYTDESGTESHLTSGAESHRGSGGSENEAGASYLRHRRVRRITTAHIPNDGVRTAGSHSPSVKKMSSARSSLLTELSTSDSATSTTATTASYQSKRSSTSSFTSVSSATPSLIPGATSVTNPSSTASPALSSIPEAPTPPPRVPTPIRKISFSSKQGPDTKDDKRSSRSNLSPSTAPNSASVTPIAAATVAYATTIRKSRPTSIAQVLEKSSAPSTPSIPSQQPSNIPTTTATTPIDDVLEKLRPFASSK